MTMRYVDSTDGTRLAVYEEGNPDGPTVVLVHGYPDSHVVWDAVVPLLAEKFRVIRYDSRAAGASSGPKSFSKYTMPNFADDFDAVVAELSPGQPVHVLGHDWGSVGMWEYLGRAGARDRVASFTSVSGPSLHHLIRYVRDGLKTPYRPKLFVRALSQLLHLLYTAALSVPVLAPAAMRLGSGLMRAGLTRGIPKDLVHHGGTFAADAARGTKIYRANALPALIHRPLDFYVDVPVQLIVNIDDPFVLPHVYDDTARWVPRLWRRDLRAKHWSPFTHPQVLATAVTELADHLDGKPPARALLRAQVGRPRKDFGDTLVSVTGAGSGIGRETALAFARDGAELVISDIDEAGLKDTAATIGALGGIAHPYVLDVSDADAVERFADEVCAAHGVPDIVVNNAGIGVAGAFLDTPAEQFDRVLDVNLGGVVNGCRAFARRLVERGTGGHIVNVASMAAYSPLKGLNAYCTSKAAVYMFSDCLRAELSSAGIGLTTICPGIINTNIVSATEMIAPSGKRAAVATRRAQLEDMFARRGYGPDKVAKAIVTAVKKDKAIRPVTPEAYLLYGTSKVLPQGMRSIARAGVV
ncbi:SDR family oxidoreductase [Mycolicibacterium aichiense]|uniref:Oxidoreductase EphD n=1 Tax=Mycolicibacterium aichiense TaxID=1799 RepID=A0AAD1HPH8_9MYCO|nr:SDR family oxidoreductase [Mycolicibacterium aichiense]MCV7018904.1 SDR family oxidoreductase [Mycolicibacterium aichiense]BBX08555.1 putative oxidoreductase EphD [Mycolicibacterium aichiense]STZ82351.1 short-chain dehydrogenase [Mycolicibacterium aichiense]